MKFKTPAFLLTLALAAPLVLVAQSQPPEKTAAAKTAVAEPLAPSAEQATASRLVYGLLSDSRYAYRPRVVDEALSQDVFKRFLNTLDGAKMYFTADDIARFAPYETQLGEAIRSGQLQPAFDIADTYRQRVAERIAFARGLLKQDFDFSGNERWEYDRKDAPWASAAELDTMWKKTVMNDWLRLKLAGQKSEDIRATLDKRYARMKTRIDEFTAEDAFSYFINAYTSAIDPHTDYYTPRATQVFNQQMSLSLEGIGAQLTRQDELVAIREIIPGGPAALDGTLQAGDRIVAVGQGKQGPMVDVVGWRLDDVVAKIKGPKDTQVRLEYIPVASGVDGAHRTLLLTRAKIKLEEQAAKSEIITVPATDSAPARKIGIIKLPAFYQDFEARRKNPNDFNSATRDIARLLGQFREQNINGVVLDLRNNGGGSLDEAVELTGLFIDTGPVVQARESGGGLKIWSDTKRGIAWDGPLAVLVNRASASATEIFAGAIQDYGRGLIIGETTFGKGTVQQPYDYDENFPGRGKGEPRFGMVKFTTAQFFRASGSSTQHKGVVPDIAFPVSIDASEYGESTYDNALPWVQIAELPHTRYGNFAPLLPKLEAMHATRTATDKEWQWWLQDVTRYRDQAAKKYLSLNEAERRAERDQNEARTQQRQAERKTLGLTLDPLADDATDDGLGAAERDIVKEAQREKLIDKRPDPLLRETATILADTLGLLARDSKLSSQVLFVSSGPTVWAN